MKSAWGSDDPTKAAFPFSHALALAEVDKWIRKALAMGSDAALKDAYHRPKGPVITEEAKAWVIHLACSKPKDLGYAAEVWTRSALARHVREHARKAGYASLARAAKATVHRILAEQPLHPEKVKYYLERRDPEFETKMREVLMVYQEVALQNRNGGRMIPMIITVSVDEKPGLQAVANTAPDLPPVPGKHSSLDRLVMHVRALRRIRVVRGWFPDDFHVKAHRQRFRAESIARCRRPDSAVRHASRIFPVSQRASGCTATATVKSPLYTFSF